MNLIIDNGNVYVPDWNVVTPDMVGIREAGGGGDTRVSETKAHRIEMKDNFSPHRPEPSSAIRISNANVLEPLQVKKVSSGYVICTNPASLKVPTAWQRKTSHEPTPTPTTTRKRSISQESSAAPPKSFARKGGVLHQAHQ
jgi:hypothetical protein